jgi:hypothetical protein
MMPQFQFKLKLWTETYFVLVYLLICFPLVIFCSEPVFWYPSDEQIGHTTI